MPKTVDDLNYKCFSKRKCFSDTALSLSGFNVHVKF